MQTVKHASTTDSSGTSISKVLSANSSSSWITPADRDVFRISEDAELPELIFEFRTNHAGPYHWSWTLEWEAKPSGLRERARTDTVLRSFGESGAFTSLKPSWTANFANQVLGGILTVNVKTGTQTLRRIVTIEGQNPSPEMVRAYIDSLEDMGGFEKLLEQETGTRHFIDLDGQPIVALDQGYGIAQITSPAPTYEQTWNWKANIRGGSILYKEKVRAAKKYLGQSGRIYTQEQLLHEVLSRWNGGAYHQWDSVSHGWVRNPNTLCDSLTGNIGWDTRADNNHNQTESDLHERDKATYKKGKAGQSAEHPWTYTGVCYADHVLGE